MVLGLAESSTLFTNSVLPFPYPTLAGAILPTGWSRAERLFAEALHGHPSARGSPDSLIKAGLILRFPLESKS